jgi:preprotein translocase subunit Sec61beta
LTFRFSTLFFYKKRKEKKRKVKKRTKTQKKGLVVFFAEDSCKEGLCPDSSLFVGFFESTLCFEKSFLKRLPLFSKRQKKKGTQGVQQKTKKTMGKPFSFFHKKILNSSSI